MKESKSPTSRDLARLIAQTAHDTKALDIRVLDIRPITTFADFFVIASGTSDRQVQAIADNIQEVMKVKKKNPLGIEGYPKGHWILLDYGDVVAHLFYQETREFYGLDRLWADALPVRFRLK